MSGERTVPIPEESTVETARPLGGSFALSYLLAGLMLAGLVWFGDVWSVLANTRFLDVLIRSGVVAYHDAQMGIIKGVPNFGDYLKSQDPIHWSLVFVAFGVFYFFWLCKGTQFNVLCRFYGIEGTWGAHAKAYYKGLFYGSYLPFGLGDAATIEGLRAQGAPAARAAAVVRVFELFVIFEILVFALIALPGEGWGPWLAQLLWSFVILGVVVFFMRAGKRDPAEEKDGLVKTARIAFRELAKKPATFLKLSLLSLFAHAVESVAAFLIAMAFSGDNVRLHVPFPVILMGVCGGYIARFIKLTPGGIGQYEWGFAAALYLGGVGAPEAVTVALLSNLLRYAGYLQYYYIVFNVPPRSGPEPGYARIFGVFRRSASGADAA